MMQLPSALWLGSPWRVMTVAAGRLEGSRPAQFTEFAGKNHPWGHRAFSLQ
jgi:hypothetical protein